MNYTGCYIELTSQCNLSCKHCLHDADVDYECHNLPIEKVKEAISYFIKNGLKCVYLSGGEPLLYNQFFEICNYLTLQKNIEWEIVTNATLITDDICYLLKKSSNLRRINISLDGASEKTNDFNRGVGTYEKIIESIILLKKHEINNINIQMVIAKYNKNEIDDFKVLAGKYGISHKFLMLSMTGEAKKNTSTLYVSSTENYNMRKIAYEDKEIINYSCPLLKPYYNATVYIDYLGNVYLCRKLREVHYASGNIFNKIIDNDKVAELFKDIAEYSYDKTNCDNCVIKTYCGKGCFAEALLNGSFNDGMCEQRILLLADKVIKRMKR